MRKNNTSIVRYFIRQGADVYLGIVTWLGVIVLTFYGWYHPVVPMPVPSLENLSLALMLFTLFIVCFITVNGELPRVISRKLRLMAIAVATLVVMGLALLFHYSYVAILVIILVSLLPGLVKIRYALVYALIMPLFGALIDNGIKGIAESWISAMLLVMFNLFALLASHRFISERQAKEASKKLLRELKATQYLLSAATKRDERLRISRDLHDIVGHQLTALSLQLEVASHVNSQNAKTHHIAQAKDIASVLMADVRSAVSAIRKSKPLGLSVALKELTKDIPGVNVELAIELNESLINDRQVEVIFRCVQEALTNSLKHTQATHFSVKITVIGDIISLAISDNGGKLNPITPGNGINGMIERVEKIAGHLSYSLTQSGLSFVIEFPVIKELSH
ncbi:hypothetical protein tinsulaeT_25680 [Thalassotalea insulae]|uniref:Signal transduction histidine kinase subgroup 3 dimerisation and phosphoacceptor domain-containing protein n=1 Tax=Thalassotalea insulae TaxID=2056778 RepID=A0ABQ6GTG8_9GAMM|nr:histidine kinase [Thalassotalea insulae]GLX79228.1 hypothetical protein tinsulaeT_25680 [Thalassotalea insulae]